MRDFERAAVRETEDEILRYAFAEPDPDEGFTEDDIEDLGLSKMEGWDGQPLDDLETAAVNLFGHEDEEGNPMDRPIAYQEEQDRHEAILKSNQDLIGHMARQQTEREAVAFEARKRDVEMNVLSDPTGAVNHLEQRERQIMHLNSPEGQQENFVNYALNRAAQEHGRDFQEAFEALTSLDKRDPAHRELVQSIYDSRDPGESLMSWHQAGGDIRPSRRSGMSIPSLNSQSRASSRTSSRSSGGFSDDAWSAHGGGFSDSEESNIFRSATR